MFNYMSYVGISNFGFIPMDDTIARRYMQGLTNAYDRLPTNTPSQVKNRTSALGYLKTMSTSNNRVYSPKMDLTMTDRYILPLTHTENGKTRTVGLRNMKLYIDEDDLEATSSLGTTVTHPKSGNVGADALITTMIDHANSTSKKYPELVHEIQGNNKTRKRLYRQKMNKYGNEIPNNLILD